MEGPGGYQFVGRTVQMWNTYRTTKNFEADKPWLLRFFDQIRFYPVSADELLDMRQQFPLGRMEVKVEESEFHLAAYHQFLSSIQSESADFRKTQQDAFNEERHHWTERGEFDAASEDDLPMLAPDQRQLPPGCATLLAPTTASVWQVQANAGDRVEAGQRMFTLEAMKMEIAVHAAHSGEIVEVLCKPGTLVNSGQPLMIYRPTV
jgi:urea carboxylase